MELIIQLVAGLIGGNATGAAARGVSLGTIGNSITGLIGGFGGAQILGMLTGGGAEAAAAAAEAATSSGFDLNNLLGGAGGGVIVTAIIGFIKNKMMG
jgi:hypothetical protein